MTSPARDSSANSAAAGGLFDRWTSKGLDAEAATFNQFRVIGVVVVLGVALGMWWLMTAR